MRYNVAFADKLLIGGHLYQIDLEAGGLRDMAAAGNLLPFGHMQLAPAHYHFVYDSVHRKIHSGGDSPNPHLHRVTLPLEVAHMKHDLNLRAYDRINAVSTLEQQGFQKLGEKYVERILGIKPQIVVGKERYQLDIFKGQVCAVTDRTKFPLSLLSEFEADGKAGLCCLYDERQQLLLPLNSLPEAEREDIFLLKLEAMVAMDPVGIAQLEGKIGFHYLNQYPLREAITGQLSACGLGTLRKMVQAIDLNQKPAIKKIKMSKKYSIRKA